MDSLSCVSSFSARTSASQAHSCGASTSSQSHYRTESHESGSLRESCAAVSVSFKSLSTYENMTARALRSELKRRRLSLSGCKAALVQRLINSDSSISGSTASLDATSNASFTANVASTQETNSETGPSQSGLFKAPQPPPNETSGNTFTIQNIGAHRQRALDVLVSQKETHLTDIDQQLLVPPRIAPPTVRPIASHALPPLGTSTPDEPTEYFAQFTMRVVYPGNNSGGTTDSI